MLRPVDKILQNFVPFVPNGTTQACVNSAVLKVTLCVLLSEKQGVFRAAYSAATVAFIRNLAKGSVDYYGMKSLKSNPQLHTICKVFAGAIGTCIALALLSRSRAETKKEVMMDGVSLIGASIIAYIAAEEPGRHSRDQNSVPIFSWIAQGASAVLGAFVGWLVGLNPSDIALRTWMTSVLLLPSRQYNPGKHTYYTYNEPYYTVKY